MSHLNPLEGQDSITFGQSGNFLQFVPQGRSGDSGHADRTRTAKHVTKLRFSAHTPRRLRGMKMEADPFIDRSFAVAHEANLYLNGQWTGFIRSDVAAQVQTSFRLPATVWTGNVDAMSPGTPTAVAPPPDQRRRGWYVQAVGFLPAE